jgi:hypothetical protein
VAKSRNGEIFRIKLSRKNETRKQAGCFRVSWLEASGKDKP